MRRLAIILTVFGFLILLSVGNQEVGAQYTQNGQAVPFVSGLNITSPKNTTYTSNMPNLNISISSLFDDSIYRYVLVYSIDGKDTSTIPSNSLSFNLPNGDTGAFTIVQCVGSVTLPPLDEGTHSLAVYAKYERISTNQNWPETLYDNQTVYFTMNHGIPPAITNLSITNGTYQQNNLTLSFTVDEAISWVGYSLDGQDIVTANGEIMLSEIAVGSHNILVYANDSLGNMGASETVAFTVAKPTSSSFNLITVVCAALVVVVAVVMAAGLLVYFSKRTQRS